MSATLAKVKALALAGEAIISEHGYVRLAEYDIKAVDVISGVAMAEALEDYPDFHKGQSVLVLQTDARGNRLHVVWGIRRGTTSPAVALTAYRPDPELWSDDFRRRK